MSITRQSLLLRAQAGDPGAWCDLVELYRPLIVGWLRYRAFPADELDDLVQEILLAVVQSLPSFCHPGRRGAFRAWLRTLTRNHTSDFWKARGARALDGMTTEAEEALHELEGPDGGLSRLWNEEHDRYVLRCLLDLIELEFEPPTVRAFRRVALEEATSAEAARELGLSVGAVYVARSRVLRRLRDEAHELLDEFP